MKKKEDTMTIKYADGRSEEAIVLDRTDTTIRAVLRGRSDVIVFQAMDHRWTSEEGEPVDIEFAWQRPRRAEIVSEADCVCPRELADRLLHLLLVGTREASGSGHASEISPSRPS
jgi:hypothetical protein